jgi:hypothetical protein
LRETDREREREREREKIKGLRDTNFILSEHEPEEGGSLLWVQLPEKGLNPTVINSQEK